VSDALVLAGSALVVVVLVALAALLGFRDRARLMSRADVAAALAATDRAASILDAALDREGRAAIAMLADGRLALAKAMADHVAVRVVAPGAVRVRTRSQHDGVRVVVRTSEVGFPEARLTLDAAPAWLVSVIGGAVLPRAETSAKSTALLHRPGQAEPDPGPMLRNP
jgi:hypothetical protein